MNNPIIKFAPLAVRRIDAAQPEQADDHREVDALRDELTESRKELARESKDRETAEKKLEALEEKISDTGYDLDGLILALGDLEAAIDAQANQLDTEAHRLTYAWRQLETLKSAAPVVHASDRPEVTAIAANLFKVMAETDAAATATPRHRKPRAAKPASPPHPSRNTIPMFAYHV